MINALTPSVWANSQARLSAVRVLPSPTPALVITKARLRSRSPACNRRVRRERNCSHSGERGWVIATRCGSTRAARTSRDANSTARVDPTAPKVAPASREAGPPGSAGPPVASAVCAVDAESIAAGIPVKGEPSHGCSCPFFGTKYETLSGLPLRRTEDFEDVKWRGADTARFSASYTLPIVSSPKARAAERRTKLYKCDLR